MTYNDLKIMELSTIVVWQATIFATLTIVMWFKITKYTKNQSKFIFVFRVLRQASLLRNPSDGSKQNVFMPGFEFRPQRVPNINRQIRYPLSHHGDNVGSSS